MLISDLPKSHSKGPRMGAWGLLLPAFLLQFPSSHLYIVIGIGTFIRS
jgi:hypothetical protein